MRRLATLTLVATMAASLSLSGEALAGPVYFDFSFSDGTITASGTLEATINSGSTDQYTVDAATGTISGNSDPGTLTFVTNPNAPKSAVFSSVQDFYDDQLLPSASQTLTRNGLLFTTTDGTFVNFYYDDYAAPDGYYTYFFDPSNDVNASSKLGSFTLTETSVPEPSTLILAAMALVPAMAVAARRRARTAQ